MRYECMYCIVVMSPFFRTSARHESSFNAKGISGHIHHARQVRIGKLSMSLKNLLDSFRRAGFLTIDTFIVRQVSEW